MSTQLADLPLLERIQQRLIPDHRSGCLLWPGAVTRDGYGRIKVDGRFQRVHRLVWTLEVGPIPPGLTIDHVWARGCTHRNCANVAHMEVVTARENILRGNSRAAIASRAVNCGVCGTPWDEANTYWRPNGYRDCRNCARLRDHAKPRRRRNAP